jgi:ribonuclease HII
MIWVAGVDEAGRGPLAEAVYAAAVILDPKKPIAGLKDSKLLSEKKRFMLADLIKRNALAWNVAFASVEEIDSLNILQATLLAMRRAVEGLMVMPDEVWIDGNHIPSGLLMKARSIIKGDRSEQAISAASILAKTSRDIILLVLDKQYPLYGFAQHKGYPTTQHLNAIAKYGIIAAHRKSFYPIKRYCSLSPKK